MAVGDLLVLGLAGFVTAALFYMVAVGSLNALIFYRLQPTKLEDFGLRISVLIPARDEAAVIGKTVRRILAQNLPNLELLVLDDNSTDDTRAIAEQAADGDARLQILSGRPLPPGWAGKNWACHQLSQAATGEIIIFSDADVRWAPNALDAVVGLMAETQADLLAVWPTQHTETWGERLVVPLMGFTIMTYLPVLATHHLSWDVFAAANGQCLAFRRRAYDTIGGHEAVKDTVLEDMLLARRIKRQRLRLRVADGAGLISCRMYETWPQVRDGYAKNILAGYGESVLFLAFGALFHWLVFLGPWLWLALGWLSDPLGVYPSWPLLLIALGSGVRALAAAATRSRVIDALLMPVSVILMTQIAARSVYWYWRYGGPLWKGRVIQRARQG
ncbi:MAG: glycosyltransferase [Chloroflexi bacterium]|nr:glycosyltransferase [Chloroflexota bacterium]